MKNQNHTQLLESEKSWNLKETSPAVSRSSLTSAPSPTTLLSVGTSCGAGCIWFSFGGGANWTSGGNAWACGGAALDRLAPPGRATARSHKNRWMKMGTLACRCNESFWLNETVSKHRIAPVEETIHGRTFWLPTLEITSSLDAFEASLYKLPNPARVEGAFASPSITDEMKINPCQFQTHDKQMPWE
jgi:hypothetical protein